MKHLDILEKLLTDNYITEYYTESLKGAIGKSKKKINPLQYNNVSKILFPDNILERLLAKQERDEMNYIELAKQKILSKAHVGQQAILTSNDNRIFILADRQCGKSEAIAMDIVKNATNKNTPMLYIAGSIGSGMDIIWRRVIDYSKLVALPILKSNKGSGIITWENGSELKLGSSSDSATIENLRGITRKCIYVDEAQKIKEPLRLLNQVLLPMTNIYGNDYRFIITGTPPKARKTWFQKTWESDKTWSKIEMVLEQNPAIKDATLLRQEKKKMMLLDEYEREYEHKFAYSDKVTVFSIVKTYSNLQEQLDLIRPTKVIIGVDVAYSDNTAIIPILTNKKQSITLDTIEGHWTTDIIAQKIKDQLEQALALCKPYEIYKPARKSQLGHILEEEVKTKTKSIIVVDNANRLTIEDLRKYGLKVFGSDKTKKLENLNKLIVDIRNGTILVPANSIIEEELLSAAWKEKDDGDITDELVTSRDGHLDSLHALLYASREIQQ